MIQWVLDEGHRATVISTRTGHLDLKGLQSYTHLHSEEGYNQQISIFLGTGNPIRSKEDTKIDNLPTKKRKTKVTIENNVLPYKHASSEIEIIDLIQELNASGSRPNITLNICKVT